ncbi:unnamed protein product, partial [Hapterophycus canaliculatus]
FECRPRFVFLKIRVENTGGTPSETRCSRRLRGLCYVSTARVQRVQQDKNIVRSFSFQLPALKRRKHHQLEPATEKAFVGETLESLEKPYRRGCPRQKYKNTMFEI